MKKLLFVINPKAGQKKRKNYIREVIEIFDVKYDPDKRHPIRRPLGGNDGEYVE